MHVIVTPHLSVVSTNTYPTVTMVTGYIAVYHVSVVVCGTDTQSDEVPDAPRHRGEQQRPSSARMTPRTKVSLGVWWCMCVCMHAVWWDVRDVWVGVLLSLPSYFCPLL